MSAQLVSMFLMFISGIAVGAVIDCTRTLIWQIPLKWVHQIATFIEWIIWILLGVCTFYLLFLIKGGQWRVVDPLAQIAGINMARDILGQPEFVLPDISHFFRPRSSRRTRSRDSPQEHIR